MQQHLKLQFNCWKVPPGNFIQFSVTKAEMAYDSFIMILCVLLRRRFSEIV